MPLHSAKSERSKEVEVLFNEFVVKKLHLRTLPRIVGEVTNPCDVIKKVQSVALDSVSSLNVLKFFEMNWKLFGIGLEVCCLLSQTLKNGQNPTTLPFIRSDGCWTFSKNGRQCWRKKGTPLKQSFRDWRSGTLWWARSVDTYKWKSDANWCVCLEWDWIGLKAWKGWGGACVVTSLESNCPNVWCVFNRSYVLTNWNLLMKSTRFCWTISLVHAETSQVAQRSCWIVSSTHVILTQETSQ